MRGNALLDQPFDLCQQSAIVKMRDGLCPCCIGHYTQVDRTRKAHAKRRSISLKVMFVDKKARDPVIHGVRDTGVPS